MGLNLVDVSYQMHWKEVSKTKQWKGCSENVMTLHKTEIFGLIIGVETVKSRKLAN